MPEEYRDPYEKEVIEYIEEMGGPKAREWYEQVRKGDSSLSSFIFLAIYRFVIALIFELRTAFKTLAGWVAMWGIRGWALATPGVALRISKAIAKVAYQPPPAWAGWVESYIEQMTGKEIRIEDLMRKGVKFGGKAFAEAIGHEFLEPMLNLIMPSSAELEENPYVGAERYLAVNLQFQMNAWLLHVIGDMFSLGVFKSLKDLPNAISWSYGLGWLSWLVMGTPFRVACSDPMERDLNRRYMPRLPTPEKLIDAYFAGMISEDEFDDYMRQQGYHPMWTLILTELSASKLSDTEMRRLWNEGLITERDIEEYLQLKGYPRELRDYKKLLLTRDRLLDLRDKLLDEVLDLYIAGVIPESTVREYYERQGYSRTETDLVISIGDLRRQAKAQPTLAQIKAALRKNYITEVEARRILVDRGYDPKWAEILLKT